MVLIASTTLAAAAQQLEDVVYLHNGSVIRGVIIEQVPNVSIKIETRDGNIFVYKMEEIAKFTKEQARQTTFTSKASKNQVGRYKGYYGDINIGYNISTANSFDLQVVNGYQFSPYFGLGGGVGFKADIDGPSIPIFANFRSEFLKGPITPFASLNVGYNIRILGFYDGFYLESKFGVSFRVSQKVKLNVGLSYTLNNAVYYYSNNGYASNTYEEVWGGFRVSFGVKF